MQHTKWIALGFSALCLIAVATAVRAQHLYYMAAILLCLPGVSYLMGWFALRGLEFTRELPLTAWEGQEGVIEYRVRNRSRVSRFFLAIQERFPDWMHPDEGESALFNVAAGSETRVLQRVTYRRRGVYAADAFVVIASDPLGVFAFVRRVPCEGEIVVYPQPMSIETLPMSGSDRFGWQEFVSKVLHGASVDPDGVRPYVAGDPLRYIHWRQTARTGRLSVIEFEEAQAVNLSIVLDTRRGTEVGAGVDTTLEYGVKLAASIASAALTEGASVELVVAHDAGGLADRSDLRQLRGRNQAHLFSILDTLARVEARSTQGVSALIRQEVGYVVPGTMLLVITSDPDADLPEVLRWLVASGARVYVVYVDPSTFVKTSVRSSREANSAATALLSAATAVYRLSRDPAGRIQPEEMIDAEQLAAG